jgi:cobalamin biosynthesis Mg chelatase CobN
MKRQILTLATVLTLGLGGAAFAQTATAPDSAIQNHPTATNQDGSALETYQLDKNNANGTAQPMESNRQMEPTTTTGTTDTMGNTGTMGTTGTTTTGTGTVGTSTDAMNADTTEDNALPSTASDLPSLLLIGLLALGAAFGLQAYSARRT